MLNYMFAAGILWAYVRKNGSDVNPWSDVDGPPWVLVVASDMANVRHFELRMN